MRKTFRMALVALAAAALAAAGVAAAEEKPVVAEVANLVLRLNGGVTPTALPRDRPAPLAFHADGSIATKDGTHPPAVREAEFDSDRDVVVDVRGLPRCRIEQLQARSPRDVKAACGDALIGRGSATVEVAFPEQSPFDSTGPLMLFNGGERGGVITLLAYAYVSVPAPTAVVTTSKLTRVRKGPYGLHSVVYVPKIAGGAGSVVRAKIDVHRVYVYEGERRSVLMGRCPDGRIQARGTFRFSDTTSISAGLLRTCTVAGG